jgi:hypothetical protein
VIMHRMHSDYGPPPYLRKVPSEPVLVAARFPPFMSVAQHDVGDLASRPSKQRDLNQQAWRNDGMPAKENLRYPVDPEPDHTRRERAQGATAGNFSGFYVALSTQSTGAIPRANRAGRTSGSDSITTDRINGRRALRRRTDRRK